MKRFSCFFLLCSWSVVVFAAGPLNWTKVVMSTDCQTLGGPYDCYNCKDNVSYPLMKCLHDADSGSYINYECLWDTKYQDIDLWLYQYGNDSSCSTSPHVIQLPESVCTGPPGKHTGYATNRCEE